MNSIHANSRLNHIISVIPTGSQVYRLTDIDWNTSDDSTVVEFDCPIDTTPPKLPKTDILFVPPSDIERTEDETYFADYLSDCYGFCINSLHVEQIQFHQLTDDEIAIMTSQLETMTPERRQAWHELDIIE